MIVSPKLLFEIQATAGKAYLAEQHPAAKNWPFSSRTPGASARAVRSASGGSLVTRDYHLNVFRSHEDGGYIADIPDLDACSAFGASPQAALTEVLQAQDAWLAAARERGITIPPPRYRPALYL